MKKCLILMVFTVAVLLSAINFELSYIVITENIPSLPISDAMITPYLIPGENNGGNRTCEEVGIAFDTEFDLCGDKIDYEDSAFVGSFPDELIVDVTDDTFISFIQVDCIEIDGILYKVGAIIVKGSAQANVYYYPDGTMGDSGLAAPYNSSGAPSGLSNLSFCFVECDDPLPVTLSSFYTQEVSGLPTIHWTTQSESNNLGWNIYRSLSENIGQANQINNLLIPGNGTTSEPTDYVYNDLSDVISNTTYWYWLESASYNGETEVYGPVTLTIQDDEETPITPNSYGLRQNYPNPFNPSTSISFALAEDSNVELNIYNTKGAKIRTIFNDHVSADQTHYAVWNGNDANGKQVSSGFYFYKLITETQEYHKKMLLVK